MELLYNNDTTNNYQPTASNNSGCALLIAHSPQWGGTEQSRYIYVPPDIVFSCFPPGEGDLF